MMPFTVLHNPPTLTGNLKMVKSNPPQTSQMTTLPFRTNLILGQLKVTSVLSYPHKFPSATRLPLSILGFLLSLQKFIKGALLSLSLSKQSVSIFSHYTCIHKPVCMYIQQAILYMVSVHLSHTLTRFNPNPNPTPQIKSWLFRLTPVH